MSNGMTQTPSMKWHKFLVNFALWASAVLTLLSAFQMLTGSQYGTEDVIRRVYALYEGLKGADMIFGVLQIGLAVFLIYTRFQLAGFREGAPGKLLLSYGASLLVSVGYSLVVSSITHLSVAEVTSGNLAASIAAGVAMIIVNRNYYQKRAHLFGEANGGAAASAGADVQATQSNGQSAQWNGQNAQQANQSPADKVRFCTRCGKKADPDDQWCTGCGTKLD